MSTPLLEVSNLQKEFSVGSILQRKKIQAVRNVSFTINKGETFALVGESGCGKSTTGRAVMKLIDPTDGVIKFKSTDIMSLLPSEMRIMRRNMQMIFQDPYASLNPRMSVDKILSEPFKIQKLYSQSERNEKVTELMEEVGLPISYRSRFPHEFSGGQKQRIGIARALALNPELIIADEPVSALDVSVQAQVLNLMIDLQEKYNLSYLFISHDLSVVKFISHRIGVMYLGEIVEFGNTESIFNNPLHPYTQALLSSVPSVDTIKRQRIILKGDVPDAGNPPSGCAFHTRCASCMEICKTVKPVPKEIEGQTVTCHLY